MNEDEYSPRLAEEIRLLVEMVAARAQPWLDEVIAAGHSGEPDPDGGPRRQPSECIWCPLCAVVAMVRGERPELAARVLDHAAELVALLRAVLADRWEPGTVHMPGFRPDPADPSGESPDAGVAADAGERVHTPGRPGSSPSGSPRVQRIAVRRRGAPAGGTA